ncbi:DUF4328 domain-containing protein [Streptomyces sp. NPDC005227]|uniref:DUF4328 domain-containing protein n=1 Tax=unclassified Streptomyces TaxID=2593676 RepID=UPI0036A5575B
MIRSAALPAAPVAARAAQEKQVGHVTGPTVKAPWILARCAQGAIAVAAVADVFRATAVRARAVHPTAANQHTSGTTSMVFVYLTTVTVVLFLVWFTRSRRNAQVISGNAGLASGAWPVVSWFVPFVNLVLPRRFVLDILRASAGGRTGRDEMLVNVWWGVWVAHALLGTVGQMKAPTSLPLLVLEEVLMVAAGILVIQVIRRVTTLQAAAHPVPPAPVPLGHS